MSKRLNRSQHHGRGKEGGGKEEMQGVFIMWEGEREGGISRVGGEGWGEGEGREGRGG